MHTLLLFLILIHVVYNQSIDPHPHNPLVVEFSNMNQLYPKLTLRFKLNEKSVGLDYGQFIGVEFPTQNHLNLNSLLNTKPSYTCSMKKIIDNESFSIVASPASVSSLDIEGSTTAELNIAYCQLLDLNKNLEVETLVALEIQFLNPISYFKRNLLPSIKLFTSTTNTPLKIILDSNYNFSEIGLYKELSKSTNNAISITSFQPVNCQKSDSPSINVACSTLYPYETFDMELIGKFNMSLTEIGKKYNLVLIIPEYARGTETQLNTAGIIVEDLEFQSQNVLNHAGQIIYPKFNFGRYDVMTYQGQSNALVFKNIETSSVSSGRRFRILLKNAIGKKTGSVKVEIHLIYKNSFSTIGYSLSQAINLSIIPIIGSTKTFASVFSEQNNDVFAPGGYHTVFAFEFKSEILTQNLFIKLQHVNHSESENYINLVASTCDFSDNPDISQEFGRRPICHPINKTLNPDSIKPNKRSGVVFKLSELAGLEKIEKSKTFYVKVFILYEICGRSSTTFINVMEGLIQNTRKTNIPYVKPEFSIEAYETLNINSEGIAVLSGLIAQTSTNLVFHNRCYQTYNPIVITQELSETLYVSANEPFGRSSDSIINPLLALEFTDFRLAHLLQSQVQAKLSNSSTELDEYLKLPASINDASPSTMKVGYLYSKNETNRLIKETVIADPAQRPVFYLATYLQNGDISPAPYHFAYKFAGPFAYYPTENPTYAKYIKGKLRVQFSNNYFTYADTSKRNSCVLGWFSNSVLSSSNLATAAQEKFVVSSTTTTNLFNYLENNQNPATKYQKLSGLNYQLNKFDSYTQSTDNPYETYNIDERNIYLESNYNDVDYNVDGRGKGWSFLYDIVNNNVNGDLNRYQRPFCDISFLSNCIEYKSEINIVKSIYSVFEVNIQWLGDDLTTVIRNNRFVKMFPEGVAFNDDDKKLDYTTVANDTQNDHLNKLVFHHSFVENSSVCILEIFNSVWDSTLTNFDTDYNTLGLFLFNISLIEEDYYSIDSNSDNTWMSYPAGPLNTPYEDNGVTKQPLAYGYTSAPIVSDNFDFSISLIHTARDRSIPAGYQTSESHYRVYLGSVIFINNIENLNTPTMDNHNLLIPVYCPLLPTVNKNKINRATTTETDRIFFNIVFLKMSNYNTIEKLTNYVVSEYTASGTETMTYFYTKVFPSSTNYYLGTARFSPYDVEDKNNDLYIINGNLSSSNISFKATAMSTFLSKNIENNLNSNENYPEIFFNSNMGVYKAWNIFTIQNNLSFYVNNQKFKTAILTKFSIQEDTSTPYTLTTVSPSSLNLTTNRSNSNIFISGIHKPSFNDLINYNESSLFDNVAFFINNSINNNEILSNFYSTPGRFVLDYNPTEDISNENFSFEIFTPNPLFKKESEFGEIEIEVSLPNILKSTYLELYSENENFNDNTLCGIYQNTGLDNEIYVFPCEGLVGNKISCLINKYVISSDRTSWENNSNYLQLTNKIKICCTNIITRDTISISEIRNSFQKGVGTFPESYITSFMSKYDTSDSSYSIENIYSRASDKNSGEYSAKINSFYYDPSQVVQLKGLGVVYINVEIPIGIQRGAVYVIEGDFSGFYLNSKIKPTCQVIVSKTNASSTYTPTYNENSKDIGSTLVEECYIGNFNQKLNVGEDALSTNKGIKVKLKKTLLKCGMTLSKYLVITIFPVRIMGSSLGMIYSVHSYLNSVLLTLTKEKEMNIWQEFDSEPSNKTIFSNLCNVVEFSPNISGLKGGVKFSFDTSNYFKDLNTAKALDEGPNEISIYFPFSIFEKLKNSIFNDFILCYVNSNHHPCNISEFNFLNIRFPDKMSYQNGEEYEVVIYGITIPFVTSSSAQSFACSINFYDTFNGRRKNIIIGSGDFTVFPKYTSSVVSESSESTTTINTLSNKYLGALQISSINYDSNLIPREKTSLNFNIIFDKDFSLIPPFTMSNSPFTISISFSESFNIMIDNSKLIYPNEYYKIQVAIVDKYSSEDNDITETYLSISNIELISNSLKLTVMDKSIIFTEKFSYIKVLVEGIRYSDKESNDTGLIKVFITDNSNIYFLRTIGNISSQFTDGVISPPISEFLTKARGWEVKYKNSSRAVIFVNAYGLNNSYNVYDFYKSNIDGTVSSTNYNLETNSINNKNTLNKIFIRPGRYSAQSFLVKNANFQNISLVDGSNVVSSIVTGDLKNYKQSLLYLQDSVFRTLQTSYKLYNKDDYQIEIKIGVPCGYMAGIYLPKFIISNEDDFAPLPFIVTEVIFDSTKGSIYLHKSPLLEIDENTISNNVLSSSIYLGKSKSTFLYYSLLEPPVDDLVIGFEPHSSNKNASYMDYSILKAKENSNSVKFEMITTSKLIQKYKPFSPSICYEIVPEDLISFIPNSESSSTRFLDEE